jgi:hypothetical protein
MVFFHELASVVNDLFLYLFSLLTKIVVISVNYLTIILFYEKKIIKISNKKRGPIWLFWLLLPSKRIISKRFWQTAEISLASEWIGTRTERHYGHPSTTEWLQAI